MTKLLICDHTDGCDEDCDHKILHIPHVIEFSDNDEPEILEVPEHCCGYPCGKAIYGAICEEKE